MRGETSVVLKSGSLLTEVLECGEKRFTDSAPGFNRAGHDRFACVRWISASFVLFSKCVSKAVNVVRV